MKKRGKKGLSVMIGYILLITFGIIMSIIVYSYLKTYVPKDLIKCDEGTSMFIKEINCSGNNFNITLKNNGKFNLAGYFIHATTSADQEVATTDLSRNVTNNTQTGPVLMGNVVMFTSTPNSLLPNQEKKHEYNLNQQIYQIQITPVRYENEGNLQRLASCGNAKILEDIQCS